MIKTATLTGALLDYYTARAEGVPAEQLEICRVDGYENPVCCTPAPHDEILDRDCIYVRDYSTSWSWCGPLIEKRGLELETNGPGEWQCAIWVNSRVNRYGYGDTPQEAICRAVVRAAFGDEVEDVLCK